MDRKLERFFEEYAEIGSRVVSARARNFVSTLRRWFACLDEAPEIIQSEVRRLEALQTWDEVASEVLNPSQGMLGSGQLNWHADKDRRLGEQLLLLRRLASEEINAVNFALEYFYAGDNQFDAMVGEMSLNLFDPHAEEFRRRLEDAVDASLEDDMVVPASDRVVSLNHNEQSFKNAVHAVELTLDKVKMSNSIESDDKTRITLELSAGLDLVQAPKTRVEAARVLLLGALCWLAMEFGSVVVGQMADAAIRFVRALLAV